MPNMAPTPSVRDAATVMLVRDGTDGLEVFMLKRSARSEFVPSTFVFPGGAVDDVDRSDPGLPAVCMGLDDEAASQMLNVDRGGLAYWVAAIRECFEEAGVLLANDDSGSVSMSDDEIHERFEGYRSRVYSGEQRLADVVATEGLRLDLDDLRYVSHWITPIGPPKRFDTRFFLAIMPENQRPVHDGGETVESVWIRPSEALRLAEVGEFSMILPTIANLEPLADLKSVAEAVVWADGLGDIPEILPVMKPDGGDPPRVLMPGDDGYEAAIAANQ
ncbi:MAG: 8-oxo-dGTP pyrophosphatase MutT (NUDIX family) [Candidatus Poriferisodalaceae bacterium]|jgi:8-oxo-dGTP pyrophosphatase MutT (NUDIX family)